MTVPLEAGAPDRVLPYGDRRYTDGLLATWWSVPRAVEVDGRTFVGGVSPTLYTDPLNAWTEITDHGAISSVIELGVARKHPISVGEVTENPTENPLWPTVAADDHNTPAMLLETDRPPLIATCNRPNRDHITVKVGTGDPLDLSALGPEQHIDFTALGDTSYAQPVRIGVDEVIIFVRTGDVGWGFARSDDWGQTWTTHALMSSGTTPSYILCTRDGDTLRVGTTGNPDSPLNDLLYFEIDVATGDITADGGTLGNLDGTGLPFAYGAAEERFTAPPQHRTRLLDVATDGSIAFASWHQDDIDSALYRVVDPAGTVTDITGSGTPLPAPTSTYLGGMVFASPTEVWLSRNDNAGVWVDTGIPILLSNVWENTGSTWTIERHTLTGGIWSLAETVATSATEKLVRPVVPKDRTVGPRVLWHQVRRYGHYQLWVDDSLDWDGNPDSTTQGDPA